MYLLSLSLRKDDGRFSLWGFLVIGVVNVKHLLEDHKPMGFNTLFSGGLSVSEQETANDSSDQKNPSIQLCFVAAD